MPSGKARTMSLFRVSIRRDVLIRVGMPLALLLGVTILVTSLKIINVRDFRGDTAIQFQATENIARRGIPSSQVFAANYWYSFESKLLTAKAAEFATAPLSSPRAHDDNLFHFHFYLILYPIAALVTLLPVDGVLLTLYVLAYTGMLLWTYFWLRRKGVTLVGACLFCLLLVSHPVWSASLLGGQFYVDRLFMLLGFAFMCVVASPGSPRSWQLVAASGCALINERAALTAGLFLLVYVILYWRDEPRDRQFKLLVAGGLIAYGLVIVTYVLTPNPYYATFLPTSFAQIAASLHDPVFVGKAGTLILVNAPFLILALFEWRAASIAFFLMLPNIFGSIGGAEKVGFTTHYHASYFPALVWAAGAGYAVLERKVFTDRRRFAATYAGLGALVVFLSLIDPYSANASIRPSNFRVSFFRVLVRESRAYLNRGGLNVRASAGLVGNALPEGTVVSTVEAGMPFLYRNREISFFPADIDRADFAVLEHTESESHEVFIGGVINFLGSEEQKRSNEVVLQRMKRDRYDFAHAIVFPLLNLAVVKRIH